MTAKAAEAFARYVALGPGRSLRNLAYALVEQDCYKTTTTALKVLGGWSQRYHWQARLAAAATARGEESQARALEWDDTTFLRTSELLAREVAELAPENVAVKLPLIEATIKVRESVRRREPRGQQANVNLSVSVSLRNIVERVAAEQGLDPDAVLAEAEQIIAGGA
ncbi:MAG: hypothetical protein QM692_09315 [Thermomicrobiales bacterium]